MAKPQRRTPGVGDVEDLWTKADGTPTARHGKWKRWRVTVTPPDGDRYSLSFDRKRDAEVWASDQAVQLGLGAAVNPRHGEISVADLHEQWTAQQGHASAAAKAKRTSAWNARVSARWGSTAVRDVKPSHVRSWVAELAEAGVSASSIESAMEVLRPVLALAVEDRRIAANPAASVKMPKRQHVERGYLSHEQVETLAAAFTRPADAAWVRFQAYTGLRPGESYALRVSSFDMLRRRVDVRESVSEVSGKLTWGTPKTWERRGVPFPASLADELATLMVGKRRGDLVFTAPRGGAVRLTTWRRRVWNPTVEAVRVADPEFPEITPYSLRHTAASLAISSGANVLAVQRMLGHKSAAMTLDTYADLFPDDLEAVSGRLDAARIAALATAEGEATEATS